MYTLSALFGMSWFARKQFMENTSFASFKINKEIEE
jgi:hypothetical protein